MARGSSGLRCRQDKLQGNSSACSDNFRSKAVQRPSNTYLAGPKRHVHGNVICVVRMVAGRRCRKPSNKEQKRNHDPGSPEHQRSEAAVVHEAVIQEAQAWKEPSPWADYRIPVAAVILYLGFQSGKVNSKSIESVPQMEEITRRRSN
jgi:hypothetical protein